MENKNSKNNDEGIVKTTVKTSKRLPHDLRVELYYNSKELHNSGMGCRKIQCEIMRRYGVDVSKTSISSWLREIHLPQREAYNRPTLDSSKVAWLAGVAVGDGTLKVKRDGSRLFELYVNDRDFVEGCAVVLARVMGKERPYSVSRHKDGRYYVNVQSRVLVDFLLDERNVLVMLEKLPGAFIRGFFDSEGCVTGSIDRHGGFRYYISASNTDRDLLGKYRQNWRKWA